MFKLTLELIRTIETTLPFIFQLWEEEFILVRVAGVRCQVAGLAETITKQISQAKAEAETEIGNKSVILVFYHET